MNELTQEPMSQTTEQISRQDLADAVRSMALLANMSISLWSGERTDAQIGARLKADAGAVGNTGRYIKNLLAGCDTKLKELKGAYTAARSLHYKLTLPWVSDATSDRQSGARLLPNMLFQRYVSEIGQLRRTANDKLTAFVAEYPSLMQQAMSNLAGLARVEDYPTPEQVEASFRLHIDFEPIPPASAFPNLPEDMLAALSRNLQKRQQAAAGAAERAMWERVRDVVGHLAGKLAQPDAGFQDTTIENVRDLITLLPGFNVTADPRVSEITTEIGTMLAGVTSKKVRADAVLRSEVATKAQAITDKLGSWGL